MKEQITPQTHPTNPNTLQKINPHPNITPSTTPTNTPPKNKSTPYPPSPNTHHGVGLSKRGLGRGWWACVECEWAHGRTHSHITCDGRT